MLMAHFMTESYSKSDLEVFLSSTFCICLKFQKNCEGNALSTSIRYIHEVAVGIYVV